MLNLFCVQMLIIISWGLDQNDKPPSVEQIDISSLEQTITPVPTNLMETCGGIDLDQG
jgi:hypothetical protein